MSPQVIGELSQEGPIGSLQRPDSVGDLLRVCPMLVAPVGASTSSAESPMWGVAGRARADPSARRWVVPAVSAAAVEMIDILLANSQLPKASSP
ncbi:MAG: hypothetical protein C1943_12260 [Halochromatium sp.]|nr:hypothetical protein [Halochromatium sp.]